MTRPRKGAFHLKVSQDDATVAYVELPTFPAEKWRTSRTVRLSEVLGKYDGPDVSLDFDEGGVLVGIEVLA